jgi:hypothetical protein
VQRPHIQWIYLLQLKLIHNVLPYLRSIHNRNRNETGMIWHRLSIWTFPPVTGKGPNNNPSLASQTILKRKRLLVLLGRVVSIFDKGMRVKWIWSKL